MRARQKVTAGFRDPEYRRILGREHLGVDFAAAEGTPVLAVAPGTIEKITTHPTGAVSLILEHETDGFLTVYTHITDLLVEAGDAVASGDECRP